MTDLTYVIREDFAGPGGWDEGLKMLESEAARRWRIIGFEFDPAACKTAWEAGHHRILEDVRKIATSKFVHVGGYIASPPCQPFSAAGKGEGRKHLDALIRAASLVAFTRRTPAEAVAEVHDEALDDRSILVLEPLRVIRETRPRWIALEQVKEVLPIWQAYAVLLDQLGYAVRTEVVSAERYGVPQTRKRAILIAVRKDVLFTAGMTEVPWPTPTHSAYHPRSPRRLDEGVQPWVSMAEALTFGMTERPSMTVTAGGTYTGGAEPFGNGARKGMQREIEAGRWQFGDVVRNRGTIRDADEPAPTITASADNGNFKFVPEGAVLKTGLNTATVGPGAERDRLMAEGRWRDCHKPQERPVDLPSPTITSQTSGWKVEAAVEGDTSWVESRPSPTIVGSFAPDVVAAPGWRKPGDGPRQRTPGSVRITVEQAGILQSFRADYPWQGTKTKQFQQVGNAMPPLLAAAFLEGLVTL